MAKRSRKRNNNVKIVAGLILLVLGIIALWYVYSMRPPGGFGDAVGMLFNGRTEYIEDPYYSLFFGLSVASIVLGIVFTAIGLRRALR